MSVNTPVQLESLSLLVCNRPVRTFAYYMLGVFVAVVFCLIFVPWQQTVTGVGRLTVFSPMDRPQNIEAQIPARIVKWHVKEGDMVKEGQILAELSDLDSKLMANNQLEQLLLQQEAAMAKQAATKMRIASLSTQMGALQQSRQAAIPSAVQKTAQASDRLVGAQRTVDAASQNVETTALNLRRLQELYQKGLRSKRDLELAELDAVRAKTDFDRAQASFTVAKRDTGIAGFDQNKTVADTLASVSGVSASLASAQETLAATNQELARLSIEIQSMQQRILQREVRSPKTGRVVRLLQAGPGETVDAGIVIATIVPETTDQAVELYVSDNDAPLVRVGSPVRLQFAGWPAIQFIGWPSIATGTFGGRVAVVDAVDNGNSQYRVLVVPDKNAIANKKDEPWPSPQFLRPGAESSGWILLNRVSLGFELWRQFNAFPPSIQPYPVSSTYQQAQKQQYMDSKDDKPKKRSK